MPKCHICNAERDGSDGKKYSARDLRGMEPKAADEAAVALHSVASSIIMFNNPPGSADTPMWWICAQCISRCFSKGRSRQSAQIENAIFGMVTGGQQKRWWQFWK